MATSTRTVVVKLSPEDLQEAVATWAKAKGLIADVAGCTVAIDVRERSTGYGMMESLERYGEVVLTSKS